MTRRTLSQERTTGIMRMSQDRVKIRTKMRMGWRRTLKQTQRLKGRVTRTMIQNGMKILDKYEDGSRITLKQTQRLKGRVTRTMIQDRARIKTNMWFIQP